MSSSKDLFHFVSTLSQNEKRNFSTTVRQKKEEDKKYFKLYNAFTKLSEFCPDKLKKRYKQAPSSKECSDLFSILLQNISNSSKVKSPQSLIREKLQNAEILYKRDLYEKSFKELEKVKKDAFKIEDYPVILEIIDKQRYVQRYLKIDNEKQKELQNEYNNIIQIIVVKGELDLLWEKCVSINSLKEELKLEKIKGLEREVLKLNVNKISSYQSSQLIIRYNYLLANINSINRNTENIIKYIDAVFKEYDSKKELKTANMGIYSNHLQGYFVLMLNLELAKSIDETLIKEFISILKPNASNSASSFQNLYMFLWTYHLNLGNLDILENLIGHIEKGLEKFKDKIYIDFQKVFILNITSFYFIKEDFDNCRTWLLKQINHPNQNIRIDCIAMSKLLDCIIYFEENNIDEIINSRRRMDTYIQKIKYENDFLNDTIHFIKEISKATPDVKKKKISTFYALIQDKKVKSTNYENIHFFNEINVWLESKLNGKTFYENFIAVINGRS